MNTRFSGLFGNPLALASAAAATGIFLSCATPFSGDRRIAGIHEEVDPSPSPTAAEETADSWVALAQSGSARGDQRACAYSAFILSYLDDVSDKELDGTFDADLAAYRKWVDSQNDDDVSRQERKVQRRILRDLEIMASSSGAEKRAAARSVFESLCRVGRAVGGGMVHGSALAASAATSAITLPIRFVSKFGIGVFTRRETPERGPGYSELLAGAGEGIGNWTGAFYQAFRVAFHAGNPYLLAVYAVTAIDTQTQAFCRGGKPKTARETRFCARYEALKKGEFTVTEEGEKIGVGLGKTLLKTFDFRSDEKLNAGICEKGLRKQFRVARRARERLIDKLKGQGLKDPLVQVVPPEVDGCISLQVANLEQSDYDALSAKGQGIIDGLAYSLKLKPGLGAAPAAAPSPTASPDYSTDEAICKAVYGSNAYGEAVRPALKKLKWEIIQMGMNPERFAKPMLKELPMPRDRLRREPAEALSRSRSVVYVIAPSDRQRAEFALVQPTLQGLQAQFEAEQKKLKTLQKAKTYEGCMDIQDDVGFSYDRFISLRDSIAKIAVAQRISEYEQMRRIAGKAGQRKILGIGVGGNKLKLQWEIRDMKDLNDVKRALTDPTIENVVIVSHGEENGKLVDAELNELPANAFERLSPSLQSISFFSCHSDAALTSYAMEDNLKGEPSYHQIRYLGRVDSASFLEERNQAPVLALKDYIETLDADLARAKEGNTRVQLAYGSDMPAWAPPAQCSVRFDGLQISDKGSFVLKVNRHWVWAFYPGQEAAPTTYPCDWLLPAAGGNMVNLETTNLVAKSAILSDQLRLVIQGSDGAERTVVPSLVKRRREDGTISFVRWDF